jgi:hypothetical protein
MKAGQIAFQQLNASAVTGDDPEASRRLHAILLRNPSTWRVADCVEQFDSDAVF